LQHGLWTKAVLGGHRCRVLWDTPHLFVLKLVPWRQPCTLGQVPLKVHPELGGVQESPGLTLVVVVVVAVGAQLSGQIAEQSAFGGVWCLA